MVVIMKNKKFLLLLTSLTLVNLGLYSADQNFEVKINTQSEISFTNQSLTSSEFDLQPDGSFEYDSSGNTNPTWSLIDNQTGSPDLKVQGNFKSGNLPSTGWSVFVTLNAPENSGGSFGTSQGELTLSATAQDFVTGIPRGNSGDLQEEVYRINATAAAWQTAAGVGSESFVVEWTLTDDS